MKLLVDENNVIVDITDQETEVHSSLTWVDVADGTEVYVGDSYENGSVVVATVPTPTYDQQRMIAYPSIQEQLDMQYWDSVNGTTTWADAIAAVKAQYPKPE